MEDVYFMEQFALDPCGIEPFDPYAYFPESYDLIAEASDSTGVKKKNILQKLISLIKKGIKMIIEGLKAVGRFIKGLFIKEKECVTADQVLNKLGIKRNPKPAEWDGRIPADDSSEPSAIPSDIKPMLKPMEVEFNTASQKIVLKPLQIRLGSTFKWMQGPLKDNRMVGGYKFHIYMMHAIVSKPCRDALDEIVTMINNRKFDATLKVAINRLCNEVLKNNKDSGRYEISLEELTDFSKQLLKVHEAMQYIDDAANSLGDNADVVRALNEFGDLVLKLQVGVNVVTRCLKDVYVIDTAYTETVRDIKVLGQMVHEMIEAGFPGKFIAFNAWLAAGTNIKGPSDKPLEPRWGQSRLTFLGNKDNPNVYKIAYNGYGIRANIAEKEMSDRMYGNGNGKYFAKVMDLTEDNTIITMEKVKPDKVKAATVFKSLGDQINSALQQSGIQGKIADLTPINIGFRGNQPVAFDYGMPKRAMPKKDS